MEEEEIEEVEGIAIAFGRAMALTMVFARLEPGSSNEDEALKQLDRAWKKFADRIIDFVEETD